MEVREWLVAPETRDLGSIDFASQLAEQMQSAKVPLDYFSFSVRTMHPEVLIENIVWTPDAGAVVAQRDHGLLSSAIFLNSPVSQVYEQKIGFRQSLAHSELVHDFPILREFQATGFTDYVIEPLRLSSSLMSYVSWATKSPGGFSQEIFSKLVSLTSFFELAVSFMSQRRALEGLLDTYLGSKAGELVRSGHYRRCEGSSLDAVIWFSDLRGFTCFADQNSVADTLERLNHSFDVVGSAISNGRGEILKFIGDAILAVFPIVHDSDSRAAARAALEAAMQAITTFRQRKIQGQEPIRVGVGLHRGVVSFGNVGTSNRLDFTVIGGPVNLAARVASLCKDLREDILLTDAVADLLPQESIRSLGDHTLRGVAHPHTIFTDAKS